MHPENLNFLRDNLKFHGFGDGGTLFEELETAVEEGKKEFELKTLEFFDEDCCAEATLFFRRPDSVQMYYFNRYRVQLRYTDDPENNIGQTFFMNKSGKGFTFKEAYNLLEGRVVYKKRLPGMYTNEYSAWCQLNFNDKDSRGNYKFKRFYDSYKYDLEMALRNYDIVGMDKEEIREGLLRSLEKGNLHLIMLQTKNKNVLKKFVQADPQNRLVILYPQATRAEIRQAIKERKKAADRLANMNLDKPAINPPPSAPEINLPRPDVTFPFPEIEKEASIPDEEDEPVTVVKRPSTRKRIAREIKSKY